MAYGGAELRSDDGVAAGDGEAGSASRKSVDEVVAALSTDLQRGLGVDDVRARLNRYGRNELAAEKPIAPWRRFASQFEDVLVILLLAATAISAGLWAYERDAALPYEALAILAIVVANAIMGFIQETRAEAAVAALRALSAAKAAVIRGGRRESVAAADLVPRGIILIEEGDTIPAHARLVSSISRQTAEAALTGESIAVLKDGATIAEVLPLGEQHNMVFSGTTAVYGHGTAVVTATGMRTEIGRIAGLLKETPDEDTPLQRELARVGRVLGLVVLLIAAIMVATIVIIERVQGVPAMFDALILGVALAVAAVPEGLPAVVTAVLSIGVQRMAHRHAIVRRLAAVETLGSASVIASDKTGTLTRNEMTVRVVVTASGRVRFEGSGYSPVGEVTMEDGREVDGLAKTELERVLAAADRANNATVEQGAGGWRVHGDPSEGALLVAARKAGVRSETLDGRWPRVGEVPFSSSRKLMSTIHRDAGEENACVVFTKGAPDVLLARCTHEVLGEGRRQLSDTRRAEILKVNEELAGQALRTLGVAGRWLRDEAVALHDGGGLERLEHLEHLEQDLTFGGLIGMIDPPRSEAKEAAIRARKAGIRLLMITGDHPRTASVIARELGISDDGRVVTGGELERLTDGARASVVADV